MIVEWVWVSSDPTVDGFCRDHPGSHCLFSLKPSLEQVELDLEDKELYLDRVLSVSGLDEDEGTSLFSDQSLLNLPF